MKEVIRACSIRKMMGLWQPRGFKVSGFQRIDRVSELFSETGLPYGGDP